MNIIDSLLPAQNVQVGNAIKSLFSAEYSEVLQMTAYEDLISFLLEDGSTRCHRPETVIKIRYHSGPTTVIKAKTASSNPGLKYCPVKRAS